MVASDNFNDISANPDVNRAVAKAMERIRLRMDNYGFVPTQTALRMAAEPEFDSISLELARALREALFRLRDEIPGVYDAEWVFGITSFREPDFAEEEPVLSGSNPDFTQEPN